MGGARITEIPLDTSPDERTIYMAEFAGNLRASWDRAKMQQQTIPKGSENKYGEKLIYIRI
jgi:hypothetical protein